jgi:hypothetical protein
VLCFVKTRLAARQLSLTEILAVSMQSLLELFLPDSGGASALMAGCEDGHRLPHLSPR